MNPIQQLCLSLLCAIFLSTSLNGQQVKSTVPEIAHPFPLSAVRLTGGPLKHAQDLNAEYLLKLEPDRMLAYYRKRAGLRSKAEPYAGWDGDGRNLTGHLAGHYLSAVSLMYAATGDARFKERADYIVSELKIIQDKNGDGYLSGLADGRQKFNEVATGDIQSAPFDLNGMWSPWYVLHKTFAGLRDAYRYTGNRTALQVETKFAAWAETILNKLDETQTQKMLNTEFGGMNEVLVDLYIDTGDKQWLSLSHHFDHHAVVDPLARREDRLEGLHANTQVPKMLGVLVRYIATGNKDDGTAAEFFWDTVEHNHSYATGGHGRDEHFGPPDQLSERIDGRTDESCNVYNMLKMTRKLFAIHPDVKFAEFEERALFNHVLASIDPDDGRTCYMVPVGRNVRHEYQDMYRAFTCCVCTGMESHGLHGSGIYYESGSRLWVNLFAPSTLDWASQRVKVVMETDFPEGESATLRVTSQGTRKLTLVVRRPSWVGDGFGVTVNGQKVDATPTGSYVEVTRTWKSGDVLLVSLPKTLREQPTPDNKRRVALMWGPLVLAGDLGPERRGVSADQVPVFIAADRQVSEWLRPVNNKANEFHSESVGRDLSNTEQDVSFVPFYRLHRRQYALYWDLYSADDWKRRLDELAAQQATVKRLEANTITFIQPGDTEKEKAFNQQGVETRTDSLRGRSARRGKNWFSYGIPIGTVPPASVWVSYFNEERGKRTFEISLDSQRIGEQTLQQIPYGGPAGDFFDVEYKIPGELLTGKQKLTLKFQAKDGNEIAAVYGIRFVRRAD